LAHSQQHFTHHIVRIYPTFIVPMKLINLIKEIRRLIKRINQNYIQ